jgi:hypothetical protein
VKDYYLVRDCIVGNLSQVDLKCKPIQRLNTLALKWEKRIDNRYLMFESLVIQNRKEMFPSGDGLFLFREFGDFLFLE